ncbi:MAG: hypothetical protein KY428_08735, partial [Bacteroidetes bacterium]|nr:hypothetical protein [Bacteroidota bacterium]
LLAGSILYFVISYIWGASFVIEWVLRPSLKALQVPLPAWEHPLLDIQVPIETYVVEQTYWGSRLHINYIAAAISLFFFLTALAVILSCLTTFSRLWFLIGAAAICGVVVLLRLEQLGVLGRFDNTATAVVFMVLLPLAYYFHAIRPQTTFLLRLIVFFGLIALLAAAFGLLATVPNPTLYVVNYGMPAWLALSFLLLVLVGPELIAGILYLVTASATPGSRGSLRHFLLASTLYLLNLILYYLQERGYLNWDIFVIAPFWILLLSIITGVRTLRLRKETLGNILQIEPYGLLLYISLALLTLSTLGYAAATANDPLLESFEDAILYTHIGMGLSLLLYIIANFYGMLRRNQPVYRVMYRPQLMPLFTARLAGLIIILGFYAVRGNYALFQTIAGYYNGIGDVYAAQDDLIVSQNYYKLGSQYQYRNHRSNYALASLALGAEQSKPATLFLKEAVERQPTPYAYANLANLYLQEKLFFDALFALRQGIQQFPLAGPLFNNLGLAYGTTQIADSAYYFLQAAAADKESRQVALSNMLGVLARRNVKIAPDSLLSWNTGQNLALQTNFLAMANRQGYYPDVTHTPLQVLNTDSSILAPLYMLNYALQTRQADTVLLSRVEQRYEASRSSAMEEQWGLAYALLHYRQPNYYHAFGTMQDLADRSQFNNLTYYKILGQWALEQHAPLLAADWFEQAYMRGDAAAGYYKAIALTEAGRAEEAAAQWISMPDSTMRPAWRKQKSLALLALSTSPLEELPQQEIVAHLRLRLRAGSLIPAEKRTLLDYIANKRTKVDALLHLTQVALQEAERAEAQSYLQQLEALSPELTAAQQQAVHTLRVRYKLNAGSRSGAATAQTHPLIRQQMAAAEQLAQGNTAAALELYLQVSHASPFEENAVLQAANLLNAQQQEEDAYAVLRKSLRLNKYSVPLLEAYALQSLRLGLTAYSQDALESLQPIAPPVRYANFLKEYEALQRSRE